MSYEVVQNALFKALADAGIADIAYPNLVNKPTANYLEVSILPAATESVTYDSDKQSGILQINVVLAPGTGTGQGASLVDSVIALFPRDTVVSTGVRVAKSGFAGPGFNQGNGYVIPVSIPYYRII